MPSGKGGVKMKGVELSITTVIIIIVAIIVLLAIAYILLGGSNQISQLQYQSALRSCCGDRNVYKCDSVFTVNCKVPWKTTSGGDTMPMSDLIGLAGLNSGDGEQINGFCFCPQTSSP
jgi:hypothetical protein